MILAVDLGSTNFKAALFDEQGHRVAEGKRPLSYDIRSNQRSELDPQTVAGIFFELLQETLSLANVSAGRVRRISITSQAQTFCVCDSDGRAISPFLGWTDRRAEADAKELEQVLGQDFHVHTGFKTPGPLQMLSKVWWWKRKQKLSSDHLIASLPSYLAMRLGAPLAVDCNLAAMSGFYSIPDGNWWQAALDAVGISSRQLGRLVTPGEPVATSGFRGDLAFSRDLEIVFSGNDHTAGAVGCGCGKGRAILTLGTAGVIYRHAGNTPGPYHSDGLWGPYPLGGYYELSSINHACSALDWADGFLFGAVDSPRFVAYGKKAVVTESVPLFNPSRWGHPDAWSGEGSTEENVYAVMEGIGFALRDKVGEAFFADIKEIIALGGGSRLDGWMQLIADIFGYPLIRGTEDGLDGAARIAGVDIQPRTQPPVTFLPDPAKKDLLLKRFALWKGL